jgi:hypothetical protein
MAMRSASWIGSGRQARGVGVGAGAGAGVAVTPGVADGVGAAVATGVAKAAAEAAAEAGAAGGVDGATVGEAPPAQAATRFTTSSAPATFRTGIPPRPNSDTN